MGTKKTHTHSQVRRTKLNQEAREHWGLLTQLIALDFVYSNHPWGREQVKEGGACIQHTRLRIKYNSPAPSVNNHVDGDSIHWALKKTKHQLSQSLLIINLYPSISLLLPHMGGGNFGKQLKTGFSGRVRE